MTDTYCSWAEGQHSILTFLLSHWPQTLCHFLPEPQMRNQGFETLNYQFNHYSTFKMIPLLWCTFYPLESQLLFWKAFINKQVQYVYPGPSEKMFYQWAPFLQQISCTEIQISDRRTWTAHRCVMVLFTEPDYPSVKPVGIASCDLSLKQSYYLAAAVK